MQLGVELNSHLAVAGFDAAVHRVADKQNVVFAGELSTLDHFQRFASGGLGLVPDGDLSAGGDVQTGFDGAVIAQRDADTGVGAEELRSLPPPDKVPMMEAPPPMSEPSPTTTPCETRPSTMETPSVPALKFTNPACITVVPEDK